MIERLVKDAFETEYFWKLYRKVSMKSFNNILNLKPVELEYKELVDILRFADIFSNSKNEEFRNIAYKIISLLNDTCKDNVLYNTYANAVLKKLNNFPALKNIPDVDLPITRELEYLADKEILKSPLYE